MISVVIVQRDWEQKKVSQLINKRCFMSIPLISNLIISDLNEAIALLNYYTLQEEANRENYGVCHWQTLDNFAFRLIAEYSIAVINRENSEYIEYLEQKYNAVVQFRSLLANAQKEAKSVAQKAYREVYTQKMGEAFDLIPSWICEELSVESDTLTGDWDCILEY